MSEGGEDEKLLSRILVIGVKMDSHTDFEQASVY